METRTRDLTGQAKNAAREAKETLQEKAQQASEKAKAFGSAAMESARTAYGAAQEKVATGARATDTAIRDNPYAAIGAAFGIGILIGFLARRR